MRWPSCAKPWACRRETPRDRGRRPVEALWGAGGCPRCLLRGGNWGDPRPARAQRRGQDHDHEDPHLRAVSHPGNGARGRSRRAHRAAGGQGIRGVSAGERAPVPGSHRPRVPPLHCGCPRPDPRPMDGCPGARRCRLRPLRRGASRHRGAFQGIPAAHGARAGPPARSPDPHPRRAHHGPRPQPDRGDPRAHQEARHAEDSHPLVPYPAGGRGDMPARAHPLCRKDHRAGNQGGDRAGHARRGPS